MRAFLLIVAVFVAAWAWIYLATSEQRSTARKVLVRALPLLLMAFGAAVVLIVLAISTPGISFF